MEICCRPISSLTDNGRTLLIFRAEIRRQYLELLDESPSWDSPACRSYSRVGNVRAVRNDIQTDCQAGRYRKTRCSEGLWLPESPLALMPMVCAAVVGFVRGAVIDPKPGMILMYSRGVAAHLNVIFKFFGGQRGRFFTGIDRGEHVGSAGHVDRTVALPTCRVAFTFRLSPPPKAMPVSR